MIDFIDQQTKHFTLFYSLVTKNKLKSEIIFLNYLRVQKSNEETTKVKSIFFSFFELLSS